MDALCEWMDHMTLSLKEMRRNQEVQIQDVIEHFVFPLDDYAFYYPPPSWSIPCPPPVGGDHEA